MEITTKKVTCVKCDGRGMLDWQTECNECWGMGSLIVSKKIAWKYEKELALCKTKQGK